MELITNAKIENIIKNLSDCDKNSIVTLYPVLIKFCWAINQKRAVIKLGNKQLIGYYYGYQYIVEKRLT